MFYHLLGQTRKLRCAAIAIDGGQFPFTFSLDRSPLARAPKNTMNDLDLESVLRKSATGVDAIKLRDRALTPKLRMLLIMVDGAKSVAELIKSISNPEEARQLLGELVVAGYAEQVEAPKPAAPPPAPMAIPASPAADDTLKVSIRKATRLLEETLGPDSVNLCLQLERCTTHAQFSAKVTELARIVAAMRSERKAAEFLLAATA